MNQNDRSVLVELLKDGRAKISEIAGKTGLSRQTTSKKIHELRERGIIKSFTVEPDEYKIGLEERAYIVATLEPESESRRKLIRKVKELNEVSQVYFLFGRFDLILEVITADEKRLDEFIQKVHGFEAVKDTETLICRETVKAEPKDPFLKALRS